MTHPKVLHFEFVSIMHQANKQWGVNQVLSGLDFIEIFCVLHQSYYRDSNSEEPNELRVIRMKRENCKKRQKT